MIEILIPELKLDTLKQEYKISASLALVALISLHTRKSRVNSVQSHVIFVALYFVC